MPGMVRSMNGEFLPMDHQDSGVQCATGRRFKDTDIGAHACTQRATFETRNGGRPTGDGSERLTERQALFGRESEYQRRQCVQTTDARFGLCERVHLGVEFMWLMVAGNGGQHTVAHAGSQCDYVVATTQGWAYMTKRIEASQIGIGQEQLVRRDVRRDR